MRPLRWVIQPTLDRTEAVAYDALEVQFANDPPLINMVIFDFGRYRYEEMTLVKISDEFPVDIAKDVASSIAGAYDFGPQAGYFDFQEGDKAAAVGVAGLIAAAFGAKFGEAFLVAALLLLEKFWFVLLAIPVVLWKWFRGGSTRKA